MEKLEKNPCEAAKLLKFLEENSMSPLGVVYFKNGSENENGVWAMEFGDGSEIRYGLAGGHVCFLASNASGEVEETW